MPTWAEIPDRAAGHPFDEDDWALLQNNLNAAGGLIAENTLGSDNTMSFGSIDGSPFRHLLLVGSVRCDHATTLAYPVLRINGSSSAEYDDQLVYANNTNIFGVQQFGATAATLGCAPGTTAGADLWGDFVAWFPDAFDTGKNRFYLSEWRTWISNASGGGYSGLYGGTRRNSAAITSLEVRSLVGPNLKAGSRVKLYGIP